MSEESTVLLVDAQHLPGALEEQLQSRAVFSEHTSESEVDQVAPVLFPDLVILPGRGDVTPQVRRLLALRPPLATAVIADRASIKKLRAAKCPAAALIPQDLPVAAIAHRVATMSKKSAAGQPLVQVNQRGSMAPRPAAVSGSVVIQDAPKAPKAEVKDRSKSSPGHASTSKSAREVQRPSAKPKSLAPPRASRGPEKEETNEPRSPQYQRPHLEVTPPASARGTVRASAKSSIGHQESAAETKAAKAKAAKAQAAKAQAAKAQPAKPKQAVSPASAPAASSSTLDFGRAHSEAPASAPASRRGDDEFSVVARLPVDLRLPLANSQAQLPTMRLAYLDTDLTRADAVTSALRRKGVEVFPVAPEISRTRWPLLRRFSPQGLVLDEKGLVRHHADWVETFRGDPFLRHVPLVVLRLSRLYDDNEGELDLEPLLHLIEPLGREEFALLDKLAPGRQVDLRISQIAPLRLVQMLTEQDRNTRLDCRGDAERIVWPLGPGYAGKAKLLKLGSERVLAKLPASEALDWLLNHDDCAVSVHEHSEPLAHASESEDSARMLHEMTESLGVPERHQSIYPAARISSVGSPPTVSRRRELSSSSDLTLDRRAQRNTQMGAAAPPANAPPIELESLEAVERIAEPDALNSHQLDSALEQSPAPASEPHTMVGLEGPSLQDAGSSTAQAKKELVLEWWRTGRQAAQRGYQRYEQAWLPLKDKVPEQVFRVLPAAALAAAFLLVLTLLLTTSGSDDDLVAEQDKLTDAAQPTTSGAARPEQAAPQEAPLDQKDTAAPDEQAPEATAESSGDSEPDERWVIVPDRTLPSCEDQLGPAAPKSEDAVRSASYWKQARRELMLGRGGQAFEMLCLSGLYDPSGPAAEGLAEYYLGQRSLVEAERWIRAALRTDADRRKARELLGDIKNQMGEVEESRSIWLDTMRLTGDETDTLQAVARKMTEDARRAVRGGDLARAERNARRAVTLAPTDTTAITQLARVLLRREALAAAAAWASEGRRIDPNDTGLLVLSGDIARDGGRKEDAKHFYQSVPPGDPFRAQAVARLDVLD